MGVNGECGMGMRNRAIGVRFLLVGKKRKGNLTGESLKYEIWFEEKWVLGI
jgi:hypothetical protein